MKKRPATTTKAQMATLTTTRALVTRALSRMPTMATAPSTSTIAMAPTLTVAFSLNSVGGRSKRLAR
jgi:hypothetical protein